MLDNPLILMTDLKLTEPADVAAIEALLAGGKRPLLIMAEEIAPACIVALLGRKDRDQAPVAAIHPPEYGHWRKAMLEDIAIATGGRVIARDLGGRIADLQMRDLGSARQIKVSANQTLISAGGGDPAAIEARRVQVQRQFEAAPQNIERDKYEERLAKLSGGSATILAGGATPVEQKRRVQLIEDAINATMAAVEEGIVPGGGTTMLQIVPELDALVERLSGSARQGAQLLQSALAAPLTCIAANCGLAPAEIVTRVCESPRGTGFNARTNRFCDLIEADVIDPVRVSSAAIRNAASVAGLILTTQTLIATKPDNFDPTAGVATGGGAELLGRA